MSEINNKDTSAQTHLVARALHEALVSATPIEPVRRVLGEGNVPAAYEVQELLITKFEAAGSKRVGRKVGLTNPAVQRQLGVEQPDFGVLLEEMDVSHVPSIDIDRLIAPKIEAELAFIMGTDVVEVDRDSVIAAVAEVAVAFEIVDSRVSDWDISIVDTIADNASSALYVLGEARVLVDQVQTQQVQMVTTEDGVIISEGTGADCLGDPINALVWVAETAAKLGRPLRAGEVVLSGALGPMRPMLPGRTYEATVTGLGSLVVTVGDRSEGKVS